MMHNTFVGRNQLPAAEPPKRLQSTVQGSSTQRPFAAKPVVEAQETSGVNRLVKGSPNCSGVRDEANRT
ncbi:hypothetical protein QC762_0005510 [Podospora pseudocomata]|uniref:Uncharacterized protein n=1 Tax=Podospora pseudocomata TaxID=2093779 RepID=A0ABR0GTL9_9PEZI|nr:hypothetical protein QC762_0005510 [Podospora pseudocomata]